MKKIIYLSLFLILITLTYSFKPVFYDAFSLKNIFLSSAEYTVYCLNINKNLVAKDITIIDNSSNYIVSSSVNKSKYIKENSSNILGESLSFKSHFSAVEKIIKFYEIKVKRIENIDDIYTVFGYSQNSLLSNGILIDNEIINVQIAFDKSILTIGTPIILGDY